MDEDVEGLQSTIYLLQNQLKEAKEQIQQLQQQNQTGQDVKDARTNGSACENSSHLGKRTAGGGDRTEEVNDGLRQTNSNGGSSSNHHGDEVMDHQSDSSSKEEDQHRQSQQHEAEHMEQDDEEYSSSHEKSRTASTKTKVNMTSNETSSPTHNGMVADSVQSNNNG